MHTQRARRPGVRSVFLAALATGVAACSPALDWREARPDGAVQLMFPCRPRQQERPVTLAGAQLPMRMHACSAGGSNFALAALAVAEPARVSADLAALRRQVVANLAGIASDERPLTLAGATPNPQSTRLHVVGRRPDGSRVVADLAFFVKGLTLYQASVVGSDDAAERAAAETFFGAIRLL
jgi:hypothetical protein